MGKKKWEAREGLLLQVKHLDALADSLGLDEEGWALRYHLEDQIVDLDYIEEEYWRQRSRLRWTLQGNACTAYFHAIANGRRRKCLIPRLITDTGEVSEQRLVMKHVYNFYGNLMGSQGEARLLSHPELWPEEKKLSAEENEALSITFSPEELDAVLESMKLDSAPGPDGFPVTFFKRFWGTLKGTVLEILNDFALGRVDVARLNYGIL
jgi:mannosylglycoprotein endo-beta-mannosidase